ncbi:MAG TPA: hypothetical protein VG273_26075 [Bryobacteraceae bacterium]|jgi:tetratricopeptide (TPR) repeat protein|nr:hypothetical protein [Bryobacteraceae bacterium]
MPGSFTRRILLCAMAAALPAVAAEPWLRLQTPDFELYTSAGEKKGRETIVHFEQVRAFFLKASPVKRAGEFPVRLVQFGTQKEFDPFRVNDSSIAFFTETPARDYIVMNDAATAATANSAAVAIHEYFHLVVRHSGLRIPVWLNEGWADVYSTLRPMGKETAIGDMIPGRVADLERHPWLSFNELTSVDQKSREYNEAARAGVFYAESWALAHMLYFAPEYEANFGKFVMALHQGHSSAEACQIAWGRTSAQVFADLHSYLERKKIFGRAYEIQLEKAQGDPTVAPVADYEGKLMLADLLGASNRRGEAQKVYEGLEAEQPGRPDVAMAMGYLALQNRDVAGVLKFFGKAFNAGEGDPQMCLRLAALMHETRQPPAKIILVLERALKSKPDYTDAAIELGIVQIDGRDFPAGISTLMAIPAVIPERAAAVYCALGLAHTVTGYLEQARGDLETCRKWSKTPLEKGVVERLAGFIDARGRDNADVHPGEKLQGVRGVARNIDCAADRKRLQVQVGDQLRSFDLPDPAAIETVQTHGGSLDFACGPLKGFAIGVIYAPPRSAMETSAGIVRTLEF